MDPDLLDDAEFDPYNDVLEEADYRRIFGYNTRHPFTGIDYVEFYKELIGKDKTEVHFGNDPRAILRYTPHVLTADIHSRKRSKKLLRKAGAKTVYGLDDICNAPVEPGAGFNADYGLLGSNLSTETRVKLFPRNCEKLVYDIQEKLLKATGCRIEVMVYGDGAFKDPVGKIWELADPVVSPGFTAGLKGTPAEIKLKFIADQSEQSGMDAEAVKKVVAEKIRQKSGSMVGEDISLGTTPRQLTDLLGSLCDLTSGSGDKGTPVILIQGYFDNYVD